MAKKKKCDCELPWDYYQNRYMTLMLFGAIFGGLMAVVYEEIFLLVFSMFWLVILIGPIIEEIIKTFMVFGETQPNHIWLRLISLAVGFGIAEWILHMAYRGHFFFSFGPALHIVTVIPLAILFSKKQTISYYILGVVIGIAIHISWNAAVVYGFI